MISILDGLYTYYGLDYISFILGLLGIIYITKKMPIGFLFTAISVLFAAIVSLIASQYGFIMANTLSFILLIRGYITWNKENKQIKIKQKS